MNSLLRYSIILLFALSGYRSGATDYYVDASAGATNSGSSWATAFTNLQSALSVAVSGDNVYVAQGTYVPGTTRASTFALANGVSYYGGFPSGGGTMASRDFSLYRTILSGDIGTLNDNTDNCYLVVNANNLSATTMMNGFTIEAGNANGTSNTVTGIAGGIYLGNTGSMQLISLTVRNNYGPSGSGVYAGQPVNWTVHDCIFSNNTNGSAIVISGNASGAFTNCTFLNNIGFNGGALLLNVNTGTFSFSGCSFTGNSATASGGGGAINGGNAACAFTNCTFTNNTAATGPGGALYKFYATLNTFTNCTFTGNSGHDGGALTSYTGGFTINNCSFIQNFALGSASTSSSHGGAIYLAGNCDLNNCIFRNNLTQYGTGGAIYRNNSGTVNITNSTFTLNNAGGYSQGGGLTVNSGTVNLSNCIFWANTANGGHLNLTAEVANFGTLNTNNTIWQGNTSGGTIYNLNPLFTNAATGDLTLQDCSPAIDAGVANSLTTDIIGNPRPVDNFPGGLTFDLGAYEKQTFPLLPEINIQGNSVSIVDGNTTASTSNFTDFGTSAFSRTFTIQNTGGAVLNVGAITFTGANASDFSISTPPSATVAATTGTTAFVVTFNPSAAGTRTATIHIANNDCDEGDYDFVIQGTAVSAKALHLDGTSASDNVNSPSFTAFGTVPVTIEFWAKPDASGFSFPVGFANSYLFLFNGTSFTMRKDFGYDYATGGTVTAGAWHHYAITYDGAGTFRAYVDGLPTPIPSYTTTVASAGAVTGTLQIGEPKSGYPYSGAIDELRMWSEMRSDAQILANYNTEIASMDPCLQVYWKFNQGLVGINNSSVNTVTDIANAVVQNGTMTNFALTGSTGNWIAGSGITEVTSSYSPAPEVDIQGNSISITDGDATPSTTDNSDFGTVTLGSSQSKSYTIRNIGTATLHVSGVSITGTNAADFSVTTTPAASIGFPTGTTTYSITFTPTASGIRTAVMHVSNDDCDEGDYNITIQGTASCSSTFTFLGTVDDDWANAANWQYGCKPAPESGGGEFGNVIIAANCQAHNIAGPNNANFFGSFIINSGVTMTENYAANQFILRGGSSKTYVNNGTFIIAGTVNISGAGTVFTNNGTMTISASSTLYYTSTGVVVNHGTMNGNGTLNGQGASFTNPSGGIINPGLTTGCLSIVAPFTNAGTLTMEVNGTTACTNADKLTISGATTLGGTLNVTVGYTPGPCDVIVLLHASFTGTFATVNLPPNWAIQYNAPSSGDVSIYYTLTPEIDVQGGSPLVSIPDGNTTISTANNTDFGSGATTRTFTILNTGTAALSVGTITFTGTNATDFSVTTPPASTVAIAGSTSFVVTFNPAGSSPLTRTASLHIVNNDCNENTYDFAIQGNACVPAGLTCVGNVSANASATCDAVVTYAAPTTTGNPAPTITYVFSGATTGSGSGTGSGATFNKGVTTVTLTATNSCGTANCSFTVTVNDVTPPVITCAANVTINNTPGLCTGSTTLIPPTVSDNCQSLGNGLNFDGSNDNVQISGIPINSNTVTMEAWVYPTSPTTFFRAIIYNRVVNSGFWIDGGEVKYDWNSGNFWTHSTGVLAPLNTWTHIALVIEPTKATIYKNGVAAFVDNGTYTACNLNSATYIGDDTGPGNPFLGTIDEARIWSVTRSSAQILSGYNSEATPQTGLVALYHFNQGIAAGNNTSPAINTAIDASGNGINGTLNGFALSGSTSNWVLGQSLSLALTNNAPSTYPLGTTTVTWTATDASNNTATCTQTVTVIAPEIDLQANSTSIPDGSTSISSSINTDFGAVCLNGGNVVKTFTIQNLGTSTLTISGITSSNALFTSSVTSTSIAPSASATLTLTFNPSSSGTATSTIIISNNDCDEGSYDFVVKAVVNPLPTATIATSISSTCLNTGSPMIIFTGNGGTPPYTFTYDINGNAPTTAVSIGNNSFVFVPTSSAGSFVYHLLSVQDASSNACSQVQLASATVNILPLPNGTMTPNGPTTVCLNSPATSVTFTGNNGTPPYTFYYSINAGSYISETTTSGSSVNVSVPTSIAGSFMYHLAHVEDANGAPCGHNVISDVFITVTNPGLAMITGAAPTACQNGIMPFLTFSATGGTPPFTFTYNINGGPSQTISPSGSASSVLLNVPTTSPGGFTYNLVGVQDGSALNCFQIINASASVTILPKPAASITGSTTICLNGTPPPVTFTGSGGTPPYTFTYNVNSDPYTTVTTASGNSVTVSAPTSVSGQYDYHLVRVEDANVISCGQTNVSGLASITISALLVANLSGTTTVCQNATSPSLTFTGSGGTAPYTFTYNINGGPNVTVTTTSGNSVTITAPTGTPGSFVYNLVSVQDASPSVCMQVQTGSATITVRSLPTATINGTTTVCQGGANQTITLTGSGGVSPYTFVYNINSGPNLQITTSSNSVTLYAPTVNPGVFDYHLYSVQESGIPVCSTSQTGTATVTVNELPTASISGTTSVCLNAIYPFVIFTGTGGTPPYTFSYNINGGATQTVLSSPLGGSVPVSVPTATSGSFVYNLMSVHDASSNACSQVQTGSATITIKPLPTVVTSVSSQTICGSAAITDIVPSGTITGTSFNWTRNNTGAVTGIAGSGNGIISGNLTNTTGASIAVIFTVTPSLNGCTGATVTSLVNVPPTLNLNAAVSPLYPMAGQEIQTVYLNYPGTTQSDTITAAATGGTGAYSYSWTKSNCNLNTLSNYSNTTTSAIFSPTMADVCSGNDDNVYTYTVTVSDSKGCTANQLKKMNVVNPYTGTDVKVCHKVSVRGATTSQVLVVSSSQVATHLSHGDGLGNCVYFTGSRLVAASGMNQEQLVSIYPNPTTGVFIVELTEIREFAEIQITDIQGRLIAHTSLQKNQAPTATFDLYGFCAGMYLVTVRDGGFSYKAKIVLH